MDRLRRLVGLLGPGFVTGASDDDPSGIATYAQAGAQYGYGLAWAMLFTLPLMTAVQEASARIGLVTGKGLAAVIRTRYGARLVVAAAVLLAVANTINVGADIAGMAAAARLLVPAPQALLGTAFALVMLGLEIFVGYARYSSILKWLALAMLAYPLVAVIAHVPWGTVLLRTLVPSITLDGGYVFILTAVLGTTISPYLFFWEASQEVEEVEQTRHRSRRRWNGSAQAHRMRIDNAAGMVMSSLIAWSVLVVSATVLHAHGVTGIRTAADAARALEPLVRGFPHAGALASGIFAAGIVGLGALAVPVLAGSASYAFSEAFGWRHGLDRSWREAPGFYAVIAAAIVLGLAISFTGLDPVRLLVWSAVINGIVAVPMVVIVGRIAADRGLMGRYTSGRTSRVLIGVTAVAMGVCAIATVIGIFGPALSHLR
jgi:NRAMP (natural resistance-associated macrophage protein)-like metal ion transporter